MWFWYHNLGNIVRIIYDDFIHMVLVCYYVYTLIMFYVSYIHRFNDVQQLYMYMWWC